MKMPTNVLTIQIHWGALLALLFLIRPLAAEEAAQPDEVAVAEDFLAHEWGTLTTLHWPTGRQVPWYQPNSGGVSELPSFMYPRFTLFRKGMMRTTARMETPVIYFYSDSPRKIDVSVNYVDGSITEYFPGSGKTAGTWEQLELIPPSQAGDAEALLPFDTARPNNHYYQARAVPEAAFVRRTIPKDGGKSRLIDEVEKFVFYRGAGSFASGLIPSMDLGTSEIAVLNHQADYGFEHLWVLQSSADSVRWKKLSAIPAWDGKMGNTPIKVPFAVLDPGDTREESIAGLTASMVAALTEAGLTHAEAAAMVATWDEQWYEEPGQRVFSILPQKMIEVMLPLTISPKPVKTVRVFVHRAEVLSPETLQTLEMSMAPETDPDQATSLIMGAQLGRFIHGTLEGVAQDVGNRTAGEYGLRGIMALQRATALTSAEVPPVGSE